uniref:Tyr recombinase domain-containing protein n=1 Tax=Amphimedon queenslandica TaxID=400682 RepID=A0A1X7VE00_AMPQE
MMALRLRHDKVDRMRALVSSWLGRRSGRHSDLESLLGHLSHAAVVTLWQRPTWHGGTVLYRLGIVIWVDLGVSEWGSLCPDFMQFSDLALSAFPQLEYVLRGIRKASPGHVRPQRLPVIPHILGILLRVCKTDIFGVGVHIYLGRVQGPICPVKSLLAYLVVRDPEPGPVCVSGWVSSGLKVSAICGALAASGMDVSRFNGHSFRIGAASTVVACGPEDSLIKVLGRYLAFNAFVPILFHIPTNSACNNPESIQAPQEGGCSEWPLLTMWGTNPKPALKLSCSLNGFPARGRRQTIGYPWHARYWRWTIRWH